MRRKCLKLSLQSAYICIDIVKKPEISEVLVKYGGHQALNLVQSSKAKTSPYIDQSSIIVWGEESMSVYLKTCNLVNVLLCYLFLMVLQPQCYSTVKQNLFVMRKVEHRGMIMTTTILLTICLDNYNYECTERTNTNNILSFSNILLSNFIQEEAVAFHQVLHDDSPGK